MNSWHTLRTLLVAIPWNTNTNVPFHSHSGSSPNPISLPKPSPVLHTQLKDAKEHAMSYADEGEPYRILPSLGRRHSGVADRALCAQHADENGAFLFYYYEKLSLPLLGPRHSRRPARSSTQSWPLTVARRRPRGR